MDLLQDSSQTACALKARLKVFLEQVNRLQEANRRLEDQIAYWGARSTSRSQDWSDQEQTVKELRAQAARALQLQQVGFCDALLATATTTRGEEEDGTGMEHARLLDRIRTQYEQRRLPGLGERHLSLGVSSNPHPSLVRPSRSGAGAGAGAAAASRTHRGVLSEEEAAWAQVNLSGAALREARAELVEARKQWHSLQVEIETLHGLEKGLESSLQQTQQLYSSQLQDLSQVIARLESELEQVRSGLATQRQRHSQLFNTKMRLEREISTYRHLLEREEGRYMGHNWQPMGLRSWRSSMAEPKENGLENGFSDPTVTPDEPKSEPLPEIPSLLPAENGLKKSILHRQRSLVILTEPEQTKDLPISTVKTQEILQGNVVQESAEGHGTIETENIDKVIKQWEGSFFRGNPKLRKKSVSLRFDLHMAAADEGCAQTKQDSLPDVEVRLIMKRSRSIPSITQ
uniref:IF rod domain-containing protein n=1 Tax=Monopterus albus TaxID=43700 RepID=A0A3Q3IR20_MONAL